MPVQWTHRSRFWLVSSFAGLLGCSPTSEPRAAAPAVTRQPAAIRFDSVSVKVALGADRQLVAIVTDASGAVLSGQDVRWNSVSPSVAYVSETGVVHGVAAGSALVTAVIGSHLAVDTVTVIPPPNP